MTIREIVHVDNVLLRQTAKQVERFRPELKQLAQDMLETMRHHQGIGLAGPQVGVMQRIFVAEIPVSRGNSQEPHPQSGVTYILINPKIVKSSSRLVEDQEGCLSIPDWYGLVERSDRVMVQAKDLDGRDISLTVDDLLARIFLHEIDHLNGVLYTDHIKDPQKMWHVKPGSEPRDEPSETYERQSVVSINQS